MKDFYKYLTIAIIGILGLTSFQCDDELSEIPKGYERMYLKDYSGLDACNWIFQNDLGDKFEPLNLDDFSIDLTDNKEYFIQYTILNDQLSACMIGSVIRITDIIDSSKK